jgi:hypothetical protein
MLMSKIILKVCVALNVLNQQSITYRWRATSYYYNYYWSTRSNYYCYWAESSHCIIAVYAKRVSFEVRRRSRIVLYRWVDMVWQGGLKWGIVLAFHKQFYWARYIFWWNFDLFSLRGKVGMNKRFLVTKTCFSKGNLFKTHFYFSVSFSTRVRFSYENSLNRKLSNEMLFTFSSLDIWISVLKQITKKWTAMT